MGMSENTRGEGTSKAPLYALLFTVVAWVGMSAFGGTAFAQTHLGPIPPTRQAAPVAQLLGDAAATGNSSGTGANQNGGGGSGINRHQPERQHYQLR